MILLWLLPVAAILHITEEFLFPGGFTAWYKNYRLSEAASFTPRYLFIVNAVLVIASILPIFLPPIQNYALWLIVSAIVFFNALFHIRGWIKLRKYSPGVITSIILYIPLSIYGYWYFTVNNLVPIEQVLVSFAMGIVYWLVTSFNHKRRAKKSISSAN